MVYSLILNKNTLYILFKIHIIYIVTDSRLYGIVKFGKPFKTHHQLI